MQSHFQDFIRAELAAEGITADTHPMIHLFIESHAILLRDFVFSGVSLSRQFRIDEIERLLGDTTSITRVDIWDQLTSHIETAEKQFQSQAGSIAQIAVGFRETGRGLRASRKMTQGSETARRDALLARRLDLVASVSALTAEALRLNQKRAGIEMDVLRLELEIGRSGASAQLVRDLHEAEQSAAAIMQRMRGLRGSHHSGRRRRRGRRPQACRNGERELTGETT